MSIIFESKLVENITIETEQGDRIKIIIDESENYQCRATVVLYDQSGSYFWSAMGKPFKEFFIKTPTSYLINKLFRTDANVPDDDGNEFLKYIYKTYKNELSQILFVDDNKERQKNRKLLRFCFEYLKDNEITLPMLYHNEQLSEFFSTLLGPDWMLYTLIPEKDNHVYQYQENCIGLIKSAFQQQLQQELTPV